MRHRKAGRHLNRNAAHRRSLFRNLARALFTHESIVTTVPKAKELRPFAERLITLAKKASNDTVLKKLFRELGPRFAARRGGYTRFIKQHYRRLGDAGATAVIELL